MTRPLTSDESTPIGDRPPTVIYVMGAGRSGSTILGVALGNCANVFYAGELEAWLRRSGVPNFGGEARVKFWEGVSQSVNGQDLFGDKAWRRLEYSLAWFRVDSWPGRRRLQVRYRQIAKKLYRTISSSAKARHIVDTSHYPLRARELRRLNKDIDLYIIYLIRDPSNVVASFKRQDITNPSKSLLAANAYLYLTHFLSAFVFLRHQKDKRLLLRYEDLIADPEFTLRNILSWVDVSASLPDLACLRTGIPFQGNRLLQSEVIALRGGVVAASTRSYITKLFQLPWTVALSRLGPKATIHTGEKRHCTDPTSVCSES